ncbi:hypothetical protein DK419_26555 [Methylobacterium terrae]|uniref:Uncharacterized protein n=1 Tax=Methylobacterium terrae TaxID=2202827 RepID=A0A2U8WTB7_9HYPH|nr:hypothetical protein [Methylobacterium terrae]AWN49459.1 hypothetical protein DK419_26555 [Methylobacterium terrae]
MTSAEIKAKVQDTHRRAMQSRSIQMSRDSGIQHIFQDVRLFGREAGADFVGTNLERIVREAVTRAECRDNALDVPVHGFGRAAVAGMAQALRELTDLTVEENVNTLRLILAVPSPGYV